MKRKAWAALVAISLMLVTSCGGGGGDGGTTAPTGTLGVNMSDAATADYRAVTTPK